ncbi:MAG TPA: electron transfer flavoprotein subunit alpha/FixB family protein, partial [Anaerolineae bacterium]
HENHAEVWVVAELFGDEIRPVTFELLGGAQDIADKNGARVCAVVMAKHSAAHTAALAAHGADKVYAFDAPGLEHYATEPFASALVEAIRLYKPWAVLMSSTANGRDLAPRVAARLGLGLTGDAIGLDLDAAGRLMMLKPAFGGSVVAPVLSRTEPAMVTVRAGMMSRRTPRAAHTPEVVLLRVELPAPRVKFVSYQKQTDEGVALDEAETLIGVGMGVGGPENLPLVYELARALDGHLVATRRVVDAGWLPRQLQVGLTGRALAPNVYIALGIRGAFNHLVGLTRAHLIVAVNADPQAEIFKLCDYGIVGDWREVAAALIKAVNAETKVKNQSLL